MSEVEALKIAIGIIGFLFTVIAGAIWAEVLKLRRQGHRHQNWLTQITMAGNEILRKVGMGYEIKPPPPE